MLEESSVVLIGLAKLKRNSEWQSLEKWNWRERLCFHNNGVEGAIQVTEPAAMVPIKLRLPPGWRAVKDCERGSLEYSLVVGTILLRPEWAASICCFGVRDLFQRPIIWSQYWAHSSRTSICKSRYQPPPSVFSFTPEW